jgi:endonuclease/exonuclease/phosphatase family metal-dependent hydrolase
MSSDSNTRQLFCLHLFAQVISFGCLLILFFSSCHQESQPPAPDNPEVFASCVTKGTSQSFDIVTFNVERFPKSSHASVTALASLIKAMDPDVVALQEVASEAGFNRLVKLLDGWSGYLNPVDNDDWNLAYLIKTSETEIIRSPGKLLFTDDAWAFPRSPYELRVRHISSAKEVVLINLHLKCCGGADNESSRKTASVRLKKYLDETIPHEAVVILGDYNDEISSQATGENPFLNFVDDPSGYRFADMQIAKGSPLWWSYPSYPSHIDHILVTNELFSNVDTLMVVKASPCYPAYGEVISDHRPVVVKIVF